ncbi:hypothetical protein NL676_023882 [Syzygium grande]|nr:hypothetical protein NL676_023882 [Syzygium grande]
MTCRPGPLHGPATSAQSVQGNVKGAVGPAEARADRTPGLGTRRIGGVTPSATGKASHLGAPAAGPTLPGYRTELGKLPNEDQRVEKKIIVL